MIETNNDYMKCACDLACLSIQRGSGPFGAIIIDNDTKEIIGRGHNMVTLDNDPTAHAEMVAIRNACRFKRQFHLKNTTLYTSCEPCPMCLSAIYWAHIPVVYYGNTKEDAAAIDFDDKFIYDEIAKNKEDRNVKMIQIEKTYIKDAFLEWKEKTDKVPY